MKKFFFMLIFLAAPFSFCLAATTPTTLPFGGMISYEYVCNTGLLLYVLQPTAKIPIPYMWYWGELPFLTHVPPHPGQELLGMSSATAVPCVLGYYVIGYGLPIIYHGSSI
jgi:hypothetical protein